MSILATFPRPAVCYTSLTSKRGRKVESPDHEVTQLLERVSSGDKSAENRLYELVYPKLRRIAQNLLNAERPNQMRQGTELVHDIYIRLANAKLSLRDRGHFFAITARAMRRKLTEEARGRPDLLFIPIDGLPEVLLSKHSPMEVTLFVNELLEALEKENPQHASIVELKLFLGMTDEETAEVLAMPLKSMQVRWQDARIRLFELGQERQWKPCGIPCKKNNVRSATA